MLMLVWLKVLWELMTYTMGHKNMHFVFDYNSGISWSIFILFVPVETGLNTVHHFTLTVSPTLSGKTKTSLKWHILKSVIAMRPVVCNFCRKSSSVCLFQFLIWNSFVRKFSHPLRFLIKIWFSQFLILRSDYEVNFCDVWCDAVMTSSSQEISIL